MLNESPILVVDDNLDFRNIVCEALSSQGYYALSAADGPLALEVLEAVRPALILVDVNMPVMSGPEFLRVGAARGTLDPSRVVMVSDVALDCASPACWRLTKPFDFDLFFRLVADFCGTGQLGSLWQRQPVRATGLPNVIPARGRKAA